MDKTDSKIRLFFELTYQKEVEIKSFNKKRRKTRTGSFI